MRRQKGSGDVARGKMLRKGRKKWVRCRDNESQEVEVN